VTSDSGYIR